MTAWLQDLPTVQSLDYCQQLQSEAIAHRADAPERTAELAGLIRRVTAGQPLDDASGRRLEVPLAPARILLGGRGARMLRTVGQVRKGSLDDRGVTADHLVQCAIPGLAPILGKWRAVFGVRSVLPDQRRSLS